MYISGRNSLPRKGVNEHSRNLSARRKRKGRRRKNVKR
jgi:hypothetical protein